MKATSMVVDRVKTWSESQDGFEDIFKNKTKVNKLLKAIADSVGKKKTSMGKYSITDKDLEKTTVKFADVFPPKEEELVSHKFLKNESFMQSIKSFFIGYVWEFNGGHYRKKRTYDEYVSPETDGFLNQYLDGDTPAFKIEFDENEFTGPDLMDRTGSYSDSTRFYFKNGTLTDAFGKQENIMKLFELNENDLKVLAEKWLDYVVETLPDKVYYPNINSRWAPIMDRVLAKDYFSQYSPEERMEIAKRTGDDRIFSQELIDLFVF